MAIFAPGALVGSISGNVGGASFVNASGSKVVRKSRRTNSVTQQNQQHSQIVLANAAAQWKTLSTAERNAWKTYAANRPRANRLGASSPRSGYAAFVQYTVARAPDGPAVDPIPPIEYTRQEMFNYSLASTISNGIEFTFDTPSPLVSKQWLIYGRPLYRDTIPSFNNTWTGFGAHVDTGTTVNVDDYWEDFWPMPVLGQAVALRLIPMTITTWVPESKFDLFALTTA